MDKVVNELRKFNEDRDWDQFHSPENLAKAINVEAGELLECFLWNNDYNKEDVCDELADVVNTCIMFADKIGVNIEEVSLNKIEKNKLKYPAEKCKGKSDKYTKL